MGASLQRVRELAESAAESEGCRLVEVVIAQEGGGPVLRVTIERPDLTETPTEADSETPTEADSEATSEDGQEQAMIYRSGVTVDDCKAVNDWLTDDPDVDALMPGRSWRLEVTSPGIQRPLNSVEDYRRFIGFPIKLRTFAPTAVTTTEGETVTRKRFRGELLGGSD
ncbi:MAG: hypothetical protein HQL50_15720, partial [Magnetococcales bacterium]|nr:hypothetical protein [Magnetococcales bacterium]